MKVAKLIKYGSPHDLQIQELGKPSPSGSEVLVKVIASSVNDWDWSMTIGSPFYIRLFCGLTKPKIPIPGVDVSGVIEATGKKVTKFSVGDEVYADLSESGFGGFAEYVSVEEATLHLKPSNIDFVKAAALPHAAALALQGLKDMGGAKPGSKILINGAGGGVGSMGIQVAKHLGAEDITGVDRREKHESMHSLGFSKVIDYKQTDFTKENETYDLILDTKTNRFPLKYLRALTAGGTYVTVGGTPFRLIQMLLLIPVVKLFSKKRIKLLTLKANKDLDFLSGLVQAGEISPFIGKIYSFENLREALQEFGSGNHQGKIVVTMKQGEA